MTKRYLSKTPSELFWLYSIGIELNKKISKHKAINEILLIVLVGYPFIYLIFAWALLISGTVDIDTLLPFHFTAMICMFLLMILTAITIVRFEKAEKLNQSSGIGLFFGIWYFFIGIWYIQPKLNEYIKRIN